MTYQDRYNSERYLDMTAYFAMKNIERKEGVKTGMREDWDFRRGDLYLADLGYGAVGYDGSHVQGGVRPVVLLQNNVGNFFSPTLVVVPITSRVWKKPSQAPAKSVSAGAAPAGKLPGCSTIITWRPTAFTM